jgi:hypothetical protein
MDSGRWEAKKLRKETETPKARGCPIANLRARGNYLLFTYFLAITPSPQCFLDASPLLGITTDNRYPPN